MALFGHGAMSDLRSVMRSRADMESQAPALARMPPASGIHGMTTAAGNQRGDHEQYIQFSGNPERPAYRLGGSCLSGALRERKRDSWRGRCARASTGKAPAH